ncbi:IQ motif-containing protein H isoform X2 [Hippoglossus hippoglossus]|uniref:IQ motif-containing protein H isoform X2 n=1 Tax=Hippoglossus hippoglossus TaxID=8267 RepID=UPI00148E5E36|nr:IQ motif-containing protein H isoform X2 [Hippoglossus hippoglossus]
MSHRNQDKFGAVLLQVQDDLRQLRGNLEKISLSERTTLDIQVLDDAIRKTENSIKKHAEDYLKTVTEQLLVLPSIEDIHKKTVQIPKWKPDLDSFPDMPPQREDLPGASQREKHKSTLSMHSLCNPAHPNNRAIMYRKSGTSLPDVHKRSTNVAKPPRMITGPAGRLKPWPRGHHNLAVPEEATGTLPDTSLLCMSIQHKAASLHPRQEPYSCKIGLMGSKSLCHKQLKWEKTPGHTCEKTDSKCTTFWTTRTPPPSTSSQSMEHRSMMQAANNLISQNHQNLPVPVPVNISKYPFAITKGRMDPLAADFCLFRQSFSSCWSSVVSALEALEKLLRDFAVPMAKVSGERLVEFSHGWDSGWRTARPVIGLVSVLENWEEVLGLVSRPGQRFKGEGGIEAAAIHIQSCWRRCVARTAYLRHCRRKWAAGTISLSWLTRSQMRRVREALQARRLRQLENSRSRAQNLAANWKHIQSSKRTIIHIPSLGYSQSQRLNLREFDILQNIQINRLCDIRDKNVEVIYVCPRHLGEDILHYYTSLLVRDGATDGAESRTTEASSSVRPFIILTPEAVDYFPTRNMCLSTLLKYSPRTLKRIRHLIQGKRAYIVGGVAHVDDLAVADELGVPILGPEPAIAQLYSTKSGGRRIFKGAEVDVPPGQGDIYTLNKLHEALAEIMTQNLGVQRWLFKIDSEHSGRGTAYCDVCHLSCYSWALQEYRRHSVELWNTKWIQESVLLRYSDEIPQWLTRFARPAKTSRYPNWACFLKTFLRQGGVVEAYPPSDSVTCLTVDLLLEPGGEVTALSCGDQLHGSCQLEAIGCTVPQTSVHPETLHSICTHVGRACLQRCIVGHVSVDLATFLNHNTMEQEVWAIDLDLTYSDQLAMTQMLLMRTGGTLNCHTGCLEVPVREKYCEDQPAAKSPVVNRYAVLGSHLFHSNLSMLYHNVFLMMCKAHGIRFNMKRKEGTVFALYDSSERCRIGMITVSEDLQGALVTFARNLSVIHQEISSSKMQEETNFKALIKNIEDVLQTIVQNKLRAVKDKPAA